MMTFADQLRDMGACPPAVGWVGDRTADQAWAECERGDWMAWLIAKTVARAIGSTEHRQLVLTACRFAHLALPYAKGPVALATIETVESCARSDGATLANVRAADAAAYAAAAAAAADAYAADAAAYAAAYAAAAAADAAAAAAADAAADAADAADAAAYTRQNLLRQCADIVREDWPECPALGAEQRIGGA